MDMGWLRRAALAVVALVIAVPVLASIYTEWLWFVSAGVGSIFTTILSARVVLFVVGFIASTLFLYANYRYAVSTLPDFERFDSLFAGSVIGVVSLFMGYVASQAWDVVLRFWYQAPFDVAVPETAADAGFFVYSLPFFNGAASFTIGLVVVATMIVIGIYAYGFGIEEHEDVMETLFGMEQVNEKRFNMYVFVQGLKTQASGHLSVLTSLFLLGIAVKIFLTRYTLFLSSYGGVFGLGYTRAVVTMPVLTAVAALTAVSAIAVLLRGFGTSGSVVKYLLIVTVIAGIVGAVGASVTQSLIVEPDELNKEKPYLENQIDMTRKGFALDRIDDRQFEVAPNLTRREVEANNETIDNIRLWDYRPLLQTYNELQIFRTYYQFNDIDIDRYDIGNRTEQVMLSAREIDVDQLPEQSQTWVNRHLVYTHGFGLAMSPVSEMTAEGLPEFYVQDIPPETVSDDLSISQPRIYYGESTDTYSIVNSGTQELDYPAGDNNEYTSYQGDGGVQLTSLWRRLLFSYRFGAQQIFFSGSINKDSRIQFHRDVKERVKNVAPFLQFDDDPYIVAADDGMYWMYDAYTTSNRFPYSEPTEYKGEDVNYMRNSVKVAVNAYTGDMTFYVADKEDSLIQTYQNIFPDLFEPMDAMDESLRDHVRYPEDFFTVQTRSYFDYHMEDPQVFYNKEDRWRAPKETLRGNRAEVEPYYVMMRLPEEDRTEYMLIQPFIPTARQNLIGWVGARSDPPNYGELKAFEFSKQQLIYGPSQIEARIDQDTTISQQITLWSQQGTSVFRGNLLVIPVGNSLVYVEPLFLESRSEGSLPQLKRVIMAQNERLVMQRTLDKAILGLFGELQQPVQPAPQPTEGVSNQQLQEIRDLYNDARDALTQGDLKLYADRIDELGSYLERQQAEQE